MILSTFVAYYNKFITMNRIIITALAALLSSAAFAQQNITVSVTNPLATDRTDQPVVISLADYGEVRRAIVTCDGTEIPCQLDDLDQDEVFDELCFLVDLKSKQHKNYSVELFYDECDEPARYPARVYADMLLRNDKVKQKNKHNNFIESITARGDCADSYHIQHHHGVAPSVSTSTSARRSTCMASSISDLSSRLHSSIHHPHRRPRAMATMCFG